MKGFSKVDTASPGNIFLGFSPRLYWFCVGRGEKMSCFIVHLGFLVREGRDTHIRCVGIDYPSLESHFPFWIGASSINQVEQSPPSLIILEGENGTLQCNYTMSPFNNLRWYRQDAGRGPVSLIIMSNAESRKSKGRYTATLDTARKRSSLHIRAAQLSDRAVYICVVSALCSPGTCSPYPNLHLQAVKKA